MKSETRAPSLGEMAPDAFPAFCRERALKCTAQRLAVFAAVRAAHGHPSVDEVWQAVRASLPTVTRESVYRILNEFASLGLVGRLDALASARYDRSSAPHTHFICEECGQIFDYPMPEGWRLPAKMAGEARHVELRVTGVCRACQKKGMA